MNSKLQRTLILVLLSAAFGCAESAAPNPPALPDAPDRDSAVAPPPCFNNAECGAGERCLNGQCVSSMPACTGDGDCAMGQVCRGGECVADDGPECAEAADCGPGEACFSGVCEPIESECEADADCGVGEQCVDGECRIAPECGQDSDCADGETCVGGECTPPGPECRGAGDCPGGEVCEGGECVPDVECRVDGDCAAGQICRQGECFAENPDCVVDGDCQRGQSCERGRCAGVARCVDDVDCDPAERCVDGVCAAEVPECREDADCGAGRVCEGGLCVAPPPECVRDDQCGPAMACVAGECVARAPECGADADCGPGERCVAGACVAGPPGCVDDVECGAGERCVDGICTPRPGGCLDDADCGPGERCENAVCVGGAAGPAPGDVLVTEVMYDPHGGLVDREAEWVEIQNVSARDVLLNACDLGDATVLAGRGRALDLTGFLMPPGGILLFGRNPDPVMNGGLNLDAVFEFGLTNSGDTVFVRCRGVEIDSMSYDDRNPARRVALSRSGESLVADWDGPVTFCMAVPVYFDPPPHHGTPGLPNPVCPDEPMGCLADADCLGGEVCEMGACVPGPPGCVGDADCLGGQVCEMGACIPGPGGCVVDADCGPNGICDGGICIGAPVGCANDAECGAGMVCVAGMCTPEPDPGGCAADLDCNEGEVCTDGVCVPDPGVGPADDACAAPEPIFVGDRQMGTTVGRGANHTEANVQCSVGSATGPEAVFLHRARARGQLCASALGSGFDTLVYVRRARCRDGEEVVCNDDAAGVLQSEATLNAVAGEQYFIFVDGFAGSSGAFILALSDGACGGDPGCDGDDDCAAGSVCVDGQCEIGCREDADCDGGQVCVQTACVDPGPRPVDDGTCFRPIPVAEGATRGTTVGRMNVHEGTCSSAGGDMVHSLSVDAATTVCVDTVGSTYDTALHVRADQCADVEAEVGCNDDAIGLRSQLQFEAAVGTTYYVIVDGFRSEGDYILNVAYAACP